jgi:hypothetical protein
VNAALGDVVLEATDRVRVLAAIDKPTGNLAIQTTGTNAAGVSIEAPVILRAGLLDITTAGSIAIAEGYTPQPVPTLAALLPGQLPVIVQAGTGGADTNGVRMTAGGAITNAGIVTGIGGGAVSASGTVFAVLLQAGGTLTNASTGSITGQAGSSANSGLLGLAGGTVVNAGSLSGPGVAVVATGRLENAGTIAGTGSILYPDNTRRAVLLRAGDALTNAASGSILGAGGAVEIESRGALTSSGSIEAATALQLRALDSITNTGSFFAGGDLLVAAGNWIDTSGTISAQSGRVALLAGGATLPEGQGWALRQAAAGEIVAFGEAAGSGDVLLRTEAGAVDLDGNIAAAGEVRLEAGDAALLVGARIDAETLVVRAGTLGGAEGVLTLDGANFVIGQAALFGAGGSIETGAPSSVAPRNSAALPAMLFDLRRGAAATATIPARVAPDRPGLPAEQQTTQVRLPGQDAPGTFGPASAAPAGTLRLALDAGASPVFLLLDAGSARGTLQAGRLGLHGTAGSAALSGQIAGRSDGTAAQIADITRPIAAEVQEVYLLNGCVIGLATCRPALAGEALIPFFPTNPWTTTELIRDDVLLTQGLTNLFLPETPLVRLRLSRGPLANPDVTLPNTAEEDY